MSSATDPSREDNREYRNTKMLHTQRKRSHKGIKKEQKRVGLLADRKERLLLIIGALCLSAIGVIAFLITKQVAVVVAMNAPLLAVIGKDVLVR